MAKYTIEVNELMESPLTPLFDFDYLFYCDSEEVRKQFEQKFIEYYFFHEIGAETHARWAKMLKARLNSIMPYYKQLYETELRCKDIDFMLNKDYTETFTRELNRRNQDQTVASGVSESHSQNQGDTQSHTTDSTTSQQLQSSNQSNTSTTKQSNVNDGVASASLDDGYLTGVQSLNDSTQSNHSSSINQSGDSNLTLNSSEHTNQQAESQHTSTSNGEVGETETHTVTGKGNIGVTSSAELLEQWRNVLINIDKMIIDECRDLFMLVY